MEGDDKADSDVEVFDVGEVRLEILQRQGEDKAVQAGEGPGIQPRPGFPQIVELRGADGLGCDQPMALDRATRAKAYMLNPASGRREGWACDGAFDVTWWQRRSRNSGGALPLGILPLVGLRRLSSPNFC